MNDTPKIGRLPLPDDQRADAATAIKVIARACNCSGKKIITALIEENLISPDEALPWMADTDEPQQTNQ